VTSQSAVLSPGRNADGITVSSSLRINVGL
jgi:hypothetical protein